MGKIKKFKPQKYTKAQVDQAKNMYMKHMAVAQIARETGIPRSTIRYYVRESWESERIDEAKELMGLIRASTRHELKEIHTLGLRVIHESLLAIQESGKVLRTVDMVNIAKVMESLHELAAQENMKEPALPDSFGDEFIELDEVIDPFAIEETK